MRTLTRFQPQLVVGVAVVAGAALVLAIASVRVASQNVPRGGPVTAPLSPDDVTAIVRAAAQSIADNPLGIAVVDRAGTILGVYGRGARDTVAPTSILNLAVSLARTTGYFSNDQAPLASRTV